MKLEISRGIDFFVDLVTSCGAHCFSQPGGRAARALLVGKLLMTFVSVTLNQREPRRLFRGTRLSYSRNCHSINPSLRLYLRHLTGTLAAFKEHDALTVARYNI